MAIEWRSGPAPRNGSTPTPEQEPKPHRQPDPAAVFAALGDPTRRQILERLSRDGPLSATQLAPDYPMTRQALVKHLAAMSAAGLVDASRQGREVRYHVVPGHLEAAAAWLNGVGRRWDDRLEALQKHLAT